MIVLACIIGKIKENQYMYYNRTTVRYKSRWIAIQSLNKHNNQCLIRQSLIKFDIADISSGIFFSFSFSSFQFSSCSKDFFILFELMKFFSHPVLVFWLVLVCYNSLALGTIKYLYQTSQAFFSASLLPQAHWLTDGAYFSIFFLCTHTHIHLPCTHTLHTYWLADSRTCYWFVSLHYLNKILRLCGILSCHIFLDFHTSLF